MATRIKKTVTVSDETEAILAKVSAASRLAMTGEADLQADADALKDRATAHFATVEGFLSALDEARGNVPLSTVAARLKAEHNDSVAAAKAWTGEPESAPKVIVHVAMDEGGLSYWDTVAQFMALDGDMPEGTTVAEGLPARLASLTPVRPVFRRLGDMNGLNGTPEHGVKRSEAVDAAHLPRGRKAVLAIFREASDKTVAWTACTDLLAAHDKAVKVAEEAAKPANGTAPKAKSPKALVAQAAAVLKAIENLNAALAVDGVAVDQAVLDATAGIVARAQEGFDVATKINKAAPAAA